MENFVLAYFSIPVNKIIEINTTDLNSKPLYITSEHWRQTACKQELGLTNADS
jgi:hypothetical protein